MSHKKPLNLNKKSLVLGAVSASSLASVATANASLDVTTGVNLLSNEITFSTGPGSDDTFGFLLSGIVYSLESTNGQFGESFHRSDSTEQAPTSASDSLGYFIDVFGTGLAINMAILEDDNYFFYDADGDDVFESVVQFSLTAEVSGFGTTVPSGSIIAIVTDTMLDPSNPLTIADAADAIAAVPEPSSLGLLALGLLGMTGYRKRHTSLN